MKSVTATLNDICIGTYGSLSQDLNSGSGPSPIGSK
jgi:hypothetical protein